MARNLNSVIIQGNLCRDPEVTYTTGGTAVCEMSIASNDSRKVGEEYVDVVTYVTVKAWGTQAEKCGEFLNKGSQIIAQGKLRLDQWEKDGVKHYKHWISADNIIFGAKPKGGGNDESQEEPPRQQQRRQSSSGGQQQRRPQGQGGQASRPGPSDADDSPF